MRLGRIGAKWKTCRNEHRMGDDSEANSDPKIESQVSSERTSASDRYSNQRCSDDESSVEDVIPRTLGKDREMRAPGIKTMGLKRKEEHGGEQDGKRYD